MTSIASNSVAMLVARLLVPAASFAVNVWVARTYGAEVLGAYVYLVVLVVIFQAAAGAGVPLLLTRDIAAHPESAGRYLRVASRFSIASGGLATLVFLACAYWFFPTQHTTAASLLALTVVPSGWMAVQEACFMAERAYHRITLIALVENVLKLALSGVALLFGGGIVALSAAIAASRLAAAALGQTMLPTAGRLTAERPPLADVVAFGRAVAPWGLLFAASTLYFRLDIILVKALLDEPALGRYGAAASLYSIFLLLPSSAVAAVYPRLASAYRDSRAQYAEGALLGAKLLATGIVPLSIGLICLGDRLLLATYGDTFIASGPTLSLLAAALPLHAINGILGHALQAGHLQGVMTQVVVLALFALTALSLVLIPIHGIEGAAVAILLSSVVATVGLGLSFHRKVAPLAPSARGVVSALALAGPVVVTLLIPPPWTPLAGLLGLVSVTASVRRSEIERFGRAFGARRLVANS